MSTNRLRCRQNRSRRKQVVGSWSIRPSSAEWRKSAEGECDLGGCVSAEKGKEDGWVDDGPQIGEAGRLGCRLGLAGCPCRR